MDAIVERACGLDVHQKTVVACLLIGGPHEKARKEIRTFSTVTRELEGLRSWLSECGCTHVAMESTGVYWKPVYAVLEGSFELIVGNAQHIRNVPGRKTDVRDSEWIADLARHGLIRRSFVPPKPLRDLRDLLRYRRSLVEARTAEGNRLMKVLEMANVKLSSVASDVFGTSGLKMIAALIEGKLSAPEMANLAVGKLRKKIPELELALDGRLSEHHRQMLKMQLGRLAAMEADVAELDARIDASLDAYGSEMDLLKQIPGVDRVVAATFISEVGTDMSHFPSPRHLASWAGLCPGNAESAGKRNRNGTRISKGNVHLKTVLVEAANSLARAKTGYLKDKFYRLQARRGRLKAVIAIAHKLARAAYVVLRDRAPYRDIGETYLDSLDQRRVARNLTRRLERLGFAVHLEPKTA